MTEEDTFNKLRRTPFIEMLRIIGEQYMNLHLGNGAKTYLYTKDPRIASMREKTFNKHGWTTSGFINEMKESANYSFLIK